jgi:hypothetical protein
VEIVGKLHQLLTIALVKRVELLEEVREAYNLIGAFVEVEANSFKLIH